jgi:ketosteroid isomerase-like protein
MPTSATLERFIACVESNDHVKAIADFYADDSSMQENQQPPRVGRLANMAHEQAVMDRTARVQSRCVRPVFAQGDHVVIRWVFDFVMKDGKKRSIEEMAWQRWEGEKIMEETFFYDPKQMSPS